MRAFIVFGALFLALSFCMKMFGTMLQAVHNGNADVTALGGLVILAITIVPFVMRRMV